MSWDADFDCGWWNYTHNTNAMIRAEAPGMNVLADLLAVMGLDE